MIRIGSVLRSTATEVPQDDLEELAPLSPSSEFALEMWRKGYAAGKEDARLLGAFAAEAAGVKS